MTSPPGRATVYAPRLLAEDFSRTFRYYRDTLGLTPARGHGEPPYGEFVEGPRVVLGVFDRNLMAAAVGARAVKGARGDVGRSTLVFETPDVDRFAARLRRRGVRLARPPTDRPEWGLRTIHLRDPDGVLVEVFSRLPPPSRRKDTART